MKKQFKSFGLLVLCTIVILGITGCDMISSMSQYFSKSEEPVETQGVSETKTSPAKSAPTMQPNTLAMVGDWTITIGEFNERLAALKEVVPNFDATSRENREVVLDELVRQQLIVADAERTGLAKQKDIEAAVEEFRRTLIVREAARGLTQGITVTDQEAQEFYNKNQELLIEPPQFSVSEIVVDSELRATELKTEILKGANFAETAKLHSKSKSAAKGGNLGVLTEEPFPEMVKALLPLKQGEVSGVFEGPDGFYIIKLDEKKGGGTIAFETIKEEIKQNQALIKQQEAILNHIEELKKQINVKVNKDLIN